MSALSHFAPARRSPATVPPYRSDCQPKLLQPRGPKTDRKLKVQPFAKLPLPRRAPSSPAEALERAYELGLYRGEHNQHYEPRNYSTGAEWLEWLRGWRVGIERLRVKTAEERLRQESWEREVLEQSERAAKVQVGA